MAHSNKILREWAHLTDLLNKLPTKSQNGIFSHEVKITCIDVLPDFLALGTNVGIVYWYDRRKKKLERLRCENASVPLTIVKIISTVDYMVASGNRIGNISIFQIPKSHPDSLPESLKPKHKQVERYTVSELHKSTISAIEWSKNGMKLFSGDKNGGVVLTELDFYMHICKSVEILNEAYEVVQISYHQQRLLISTTYRSIICQKLDKWIVCQVGKKDRKVLGNFGGIIYQNSFKSTDVILYCTRPGLRIWISDVDGNVQNTLLFKDILYKECPEVPLVNPISRNLRSLKPQKEPSFGILLPFNDNLLITHNNDIIYILDPKEMIILNTISHLRSIIDIAAHKDEIFILEGDRSVVRISYKPELVYGVSPSTPESNIFSSIPTSVQNITKLQTSGIISAIPPLLDGTLFDNVDIHTDETLIMHAEEAKEFPLKIRDMNFETLKTFDDIGKLEFSDKILFKSNKKKKHSSMCASTVSLSSNSSEEKDLSYTRPTIMNLSAVGVLPDLRSPESIKNDIEYKEKILADVLNLDKIKFNLDNVKENNIGDSDNSKNSSSDSIYSHNSIPKVKVKQTDKLPNKKEHIKEIIIPSSFSKNTPDLRNIPNEWKLSDIQLNINRDSASTSDTSLTDWEIV